MAGNIPKGLACLLALTVGCGTAWSEEYAVVESDAADYPAGTVLDAAGAIMLAEDEFIVIATESGELVRIEGPHDGLAVGEPESEAGARDGLLRLVGAARPEVGGLAGVRGGEDEAAGPDTRPEAWLVHAGRTGDQCVIADGPIELWREQTGGTGRAELVEMASDASAELRWAGAAQRAEWPFDALPVDDGIYLVRPADAVRSVAIRLHRLAPGVAANRTSAIAWLAAKGCTGQARLLLRELG